MTCKMGTIFLQSSLLVVENKYSAERSRCILTTFDTIDSRCVSNQCTTLSLQFPQYSFLTRKNKWKRSFALNTGSLPNNDEQDNLNIDDGGSGLGQTRLGRIVTAGGKQLLEKFNSARRNFPMKVFLLLLGFYTANALATILGQTGDWDVLVAGVVVAAIEGIGFLMYRKSKARSSGKLQSFVVMINYWKAGVCLGLFVDAFKLGS